MTIRTALVGYGFGGRSFHAPFVAADSDLTLAAVVTSDPERSRQVRAEHPEAEVVPSLETLLARADDFGLELGIVSTPPFGHARQATALLEAGLHVVVDKPLTVTSEEGHALIACAERVGRTLTPYQNRRWDGDYLTLRRLLNAGQLGEVHRFESRFERWKPSETRAWKAGASTTGAGVLYDLGTHLIDQAVQLLGEVDDAYAEIRTLRAGSDADDDTFVALQHASGTISHLWMSAVAPQLGPRFRALGSRAGFTSWGAEPVAQRLTAETPGDRSALAEHKDGRYGQVGVAEDQRRVRLAGDDYGAFYRGVARAISTGTPPPVDARDSVAVIELIERLHREHTGPR
ncbi:oxidoreductase [Nostocoides sp. F2B08]|uniref:Gfo/Idh/MocA family protein n=1 Tax=Nostocoides sp. F2B08 TaxID=2653936 RepID=UPI0012636638|nr:Gfo/Idh/MocA family oxidoreductase [Tetrasphaera sp. F2B08]KAB7741374.1 oxidoreductase [Tetrasphaera sp. F2B08]